MNKKENARSGLLSRHRPSLTVMGREGGGMKKTASSFGIKSMRGRNAYEELA